MNQPNGFDQNMIDLLKTIHQKQEYLETQRIELWKSYIWNLLTISVLFIGFLPQFIEFGDVNKCLSTLFIIWEILLFLVVFLTILTYINSIEHAQCNEKRNNFLYQIIAKAQDDIHSKDLTHTEIKDTVTKDIGDIQNEISENIRKFSNTHTSMSLRINSLFLLWFLLVSLSTLLIVYK